MPRGECIHYTELLRGDYHYVTTEKFPCHEKKMASAASYNGRLVQIAYTLALLINFICTVLRMKPRVVVLQGCWVYRCTSGKHCAAEPHCQGGQVILLLGYNPFQAQFTKQV